MKHYDSTNATGYRGPEMDRRGALRLLAGGAATAATTGLGGLEAKAADLSGVNFDGQAVYYNGQIVGTCIHDKGADVTLRKKGVWGPKANIQSTGGFLSPLSLEAIGIYTARNADSEQQFLTSDGQAVICHTSPGYAFTFDQDGDIATIAWYKEMAKQDVAGGEGGGAGGAGGGAGGAGGSGGGSPGGGSAGGGTSGGTAAGDPSDGDSGGRS